MSRPRLLALLLALVTLAVYLPAARHDFLCYDDDQYVTENPVAQNGLTLGNLKWAFTTGYYSSWHPLTWLSHMTDCELFGLNPGAHHLVNVILHAANAALLFLLMLRLTGKMWPAAVVAALFAWHPLHVESVAWISERKDVLSAFFGLLTLLAYARHAQAKSRPAYWLAVGFFALGLMAKPMLVTLPGVMLLLDYWPLARFAPGTFRRELLAEKIPFLLLAAASCIVTFLVQQHGQAVASLEAVPLVFRLENAAVAFALYLVKTFWPSPLAVLYPLAPIPAAELVVCLALLAVVTLGIWRLARRERCWLVGWLWFLGMLVPVIGIVQVGSAALADRYTYLPSIGIFMALAYGLPPLLGETARKWLSYAVTLILLAALARMEWQLQYWRNSETLFRHALAVTKDNDIAHLNLAVALEQQGRLEEALAEYRETLRLSPYRYQVHYPAGCLLDKLNRPAEALAEFQAALRHNPRVALWHYGAGNQLASLGQPDAALREYAEAARLDPHFARPLLATAQIYLAQGRDADAAESLRQAAQAEPDSFETLAVAAHYLAANENAAGRDGQSALRFALKADELSGHTQPKVLDFLGMACAETGDFGRASASAGEAIQLAETTGLDPAPLQQRLALYQNRQPWRESFRATNAPAGR